MGKKELTLNVTVNVAGARGDREIEARARASTEQAIQSALRELDTRQLRKSMLRSRPSQEAWRPGMDDRRDLLVRAAGLTCELRRVLDAAGVAPTTRRRSRFPILRGPELRTTILARIDRLTFNQPTEAVRNAFPAGRRVSRSTLHRWRQRHAATPSRDA